METRQAKTLHSQGKGAGTRRAKTLHSYITQEDPRPRGWQRKEDAEEKVEEEEERERECVSEGREGKMANAGSWESEHCERRHLTAVRCWAGSTRLAPKQAGN